jgi:hypothetical protein
MILASMDSLGTLYVNRDAVEAPTGTVQCSIQVTQLRMAVVLIA